MKYRKGFKYQLAYDEWFSTGLRPASSIVTGYIDLDVSGNMKVKEGYAWDGPSGPTYDSGSSMRGSLFHDAAYQLIRMELLHPKWRKEADDQFGLFLKEDGMWWIRRKLWVRAVKMLAASAASPSSVKKVYTAP